ncbi:diguanylate cyclase domain-containing protein [Robertmurraya sp. P23]|uniref:diguanylate cyclase domain-containing protein n=1 Tax=Robertmurraya sp. P23 TaxID=3436931 RepID=UPI003D97F469
MIGNELFHRRNIILFTLMVAFFSIQVTINIVIEGIANVFPLGFLFITVGILLLMMNLKKVNPRLIMYVMITCTYIYFYFLLTDSPYLVNYLFMWLGLPLSAIYQSYRVVFLALTGSMILNYYSFFYLHEEIFPNVVKGDFVYLVLFGVFSTAFLLTYIHMTLRQWKETKEANEKLQVIAYHDPLTGAANRLLLKKKFDQLKESKVDSIALLFMDMNKFKYINDTYGHDVGDQLLAKVVSRVRGELKELDLLCRLGGDEFVILLSNIKYKELVGLSTRIRSSMEQPLSINNHTIQVSASIGLSYTTEVSHVDLDTLIKEADGNMYMEKRKGTRGQAL